MYGIYACLDDKGDTMYVGSSGISLEKLERNHRNYYKYNDGYESNFRKNLRYNGENWTFKWIQEPRCVSRRQIEIEEGALIRLLDPEFNIDYYPFEHSVKRGRMESV